MFAVPNTIFVLFPIFGSYEKFGFPNIGQPDILPTPDESESNSIALLDFSARNVDFGFLMLFRRMYEQKPRRFLLPFCSRLDSVTYPRRGE